MKHLKDKAFEDFIPYARAELWLNRDPEIVKEREKRALAKELERRKGKKDLMYDWELKYGTLLHLLIENAIAKVTSGQWEIFLSRNHVLTLELLPFLADNNNYSAGPEHRIVAPHTTVVSDIVEEFRNNDKDARRFIQQVLNNSDLKINDIVYEYHRSPALIVRIKIAERYWADNPGKKDEYKGDA